MPAELEEGDFLEAGVVRTGISKRQIVFVLS